MQMIEQHWNGNEKKISNIQTTVLIRSAHNFFADFLISQHRLVGKTRNKMKETENFFQY